MLVVMNMRRAKRMRSGFTVKIKIQERLVVRHRHVNFVHEHMAVNPARGTT